MNVKEYIEQHNAINYCEAIIYPNGEIEDAIPSHTYKLMAITKKSKEELDKLIPDRACPLDWLLGYTGCIAIWHTFFKYDGFITNEQYDTIHELVIHDILSDNIIGYYTDEFSRCDLLDKFYRGEIELEDIPEKPNKNIIIGKQACYKLDNNNK